MSQLYVGSQDIVHRRPLRQYLANVWLPAFKRSNSKYPRTLQILRAPEWPIYPEIRKEPGTRNLRHILTTDLWKFTVQTQNFMLNKVERMYLQNMARVKEEESELLRLPSRNIVTYDEEDIQRLSHIDNEDDCISVLQDYVLGTVSEAMRLIHGVPLNSPAAASLQFQNVSHLCVAHHARWDILALPRDNAGRHPFVVFFVPPWEFGTDDFDDFTKARTFGDNVLDVLDTDQHTAAYKLWAVIHDTCFGRTKYFAVTNYTRWCFGEIGPGCTVAGVTIPMEAPILNLDGTYEPSPSCYGFNVIEFFLFWINQAVQRQGKF
ncbi:hypothetical protein Hypma_013866 [Hypsizygus marmoreus]|uniref:Uncharacterized protein n=1 Tax=Hypsizygus marmoreus TaxID=39966 RepID=A0A369K539_HYPMA|nr:hypothetical protein Hypma_013866 [Hypsizygus marmoreus]